MWPKLWPNLAPIQTRSLSSKKFNVLILLKYPLKRRYSTFDEDMVFIKSPGFGLVQFCETQEHGRSIKHV